jgi:hypothetical protein
MLRTIEHHPLPLPDDVDEDAGGGAAFPFCRHDQADGHGWRAPFR